MTQTLSLLENGTLELNNEVITINDPKQRRNQRLLFFSSIGWVAFGAISLYDAWDEPDMLKIILFGFVAVVNTGLVIHYFRSSWAQTIFLDDVKSAKVKTGFNNANLILKLENGRIRTVFAKKERAEELKAFVSANFPA